MDLKLLEEEQRVITGIHEVYGAVYRQIGFDDLLSRTRYRANTLFHMARIANSKRGSVRRLEEDFGIGLPLGKVWMDRLDEKLAIAHSRWRRDPSSAARASDRIVFARRSTLNRSLRTSSSRTVSARTANPVSRRCCLP